MMSRIQLKISVDACCENDCHGQTEKNDFVEVIAYKHIFLPSHQRRRYGIYFEMCGCFNVKRRLPDRNF